MTSDAVHLLVGAYAVDALTPAERLVFEAHLLHCPACRVEALGLREAAAHLGAVVVPPADLRLRVMRGASTVRPLPPVAAIAEPALAPVVPLRRARFRPAGLVAAAAVLAILAAGAVAVTQDAGSPGPVGVAAQVLHAPDRTHSSVQSSRGWEASIWHSDSLGRAVLVTSDFPKAPHGLVYQLWLRQPHSGAVPAGLMPAGSDQEVVLDGDATTANGAAITLEPAGGSTRPTSKPIATFDFGQSA